MQATFWRVAAGGYLIFALGQCQYLSAREADPSQADAATVVTDDAPAANDDTANRTVNPNPTTATGNDGNRWRYKHHQGRWWYWLPSKRWVVWRDGQWVDPPTETIVTNNSSPEYQSEPGYIVPAPSRAAPILQPRPRSWYYTGRTYDGPYYYYDEFYEPYGGSRPHPDYPIPRPYPPRSRSSHYHDHYHGHHDHYPGHHEHDEPGVGISVGGGRSAVRIGIGF